MGVRLPNHVEGESPEGDICMFPANRALLSQAIVTIWLRKNSKGMAGEKKLEEIVALRQTSAQCFSAVKVSLMGRDLSLA